MELDRVAVVERNLDTYLDSARPSHVLLDRGEPIRPGTGLTAIEARRLFADQYLSRSLDVAARRLKRTGRSYYTISSAGHEVDAVLGGLLRVTDPCFLHYRSGGLMMARERRGGGGTPLFDALLSLCASRDDPVCAGRHKVWGSRALWVPPQTSTIASHLPKAVGMAFSLGRAHRMGIATGLPSDAIICCSFGDASANHATALTGINAARYAHRRGNRVPLLFVCEDNGIGISVDTPAHWIDDAYRALPYLRYFEAAGEIEEVYDTVGRAIETCRSTRGPVFLHLRCVRLWGHAGSDVETTYRTPEEIEAIEARDPLLRTARRLVETGAATPEQLRAIVADLRARVAAAEEEASSRGHLASREEVIEPLVRHDPERCRERASAPVDAKARAALWSNGLPERATAPSRRTMAAHINHALTDAMLRYPEMVAFGEDVGRKGGVYHLTAGLQQRFGIARCFDTLLDETTILGVAQGAAMAGLLPVPEIQYLAYVHNAIDQLRGEACSTAFFSGGRFDTPIVVRIAGFAYQKGFGGHFHNDNSIGALREIPGLILAAPARGDDAARMLRGCMAVAHICRRVACFLEPIALYHEKDLYEDGDGAWLFDYPAPGDALFPGEVGEYASDARDVLLVSYANGLRLSLRAARTLEREHGLRARVLDLRWLSPLPHEAVRAAADACGAVVVVDECRGTGGGPADALVARLAETGYARPLRSVRAADTYVPLGPSTEFVLVTEEQIVAATREACGR